MLSLIFIQTPGLIIDAFGELRDQQEQVKEDMEVRSYNLLVVELQGTYRKVSATWKYYQNVNYTGDNSF